MPGSKSKLVARFIPHDGATSRFDLWAKADRVGNNGVAGVPDRDLQTHPSMKTYLALLLVFPAFATAEPAARTMSEYFKGPVQAGDVVCDVQQDCYLTVTANPVLTPGDDSTGALAKGAIVPSQRHFTRVEIAQILGELERGRIKPSGPVDVYVKVQWNAVDSGPLGKSLKGQHIVRGKLSFEDGTAKFTVTSVPDQMLLGMYQPSLDVAEAFGMRTPGENDAIKSAQNLWLETILARVLPAALGLAPEVAPKP